MFDNPNMKNLIYTYIYLFIENIFRHFDFSNELNAKENKT